MDAPPATLAIPLDLDAIAALCRRHHVKRLDVFGSAVAGDFDPERSDLDLLVEFEEMPEARTARNYFDLLHALEGLAGRKVDLVQPGAVRNPFVRRRMAEQRRTLFGHAA